MMGGLVVVVVVEAAAVVVVVDGGGDGGLPSAVRAAARLACVCAQRVFCVDCVTFASIVIVVVVLPPLNRPAHPTRMVHMMHKMHTRHRQSAVVDRCHQRNIVGACREAERAGNDHFCDVCVLPVVSCRVVSCRVVCVCARFVGNRPVVTCARATRLCTRVGTVRGPQSSTFPAPCHVCV
jgi:hypothetical protein